MNINGLAQNSINDNSIEDLMCQPWVVRCHSYLGLGTGPALSVAVVMFYLTPLVVEPSLASVMTSPQEELAAPGPAPRMANQLPCPALLSLLHGYFILSLEVIFNPFLSHDSTSNKLKLPTAEQSLKSSHRC